VREREKSKREIKKLRGSDREILTVIEFFFFWIIELLVEA
jgi:hypothetical protein